MGQAFALLRHRLGARKSAQFGYALGGGPAPGGHDEAAPKHDRTEELAWAAGFFDGEGNVCVTKHRSHAGYVVVEAAVTQAGRDGVPEELRRFQAAVGGVGRIHGPFVQRGAGKPIYRWKLYKASQIASVIGALRPWLGSLKTTQADRAFSILAAQAPLARGNPSWGAYKTHCIHGHEYASARLRPYRPRRGGAERRDSKQCLVCTRIQASERRRLRRQEKPANSSAGIRCLQRAACDRSYLLK
ncbi:MAG: hypothetical protein ACRDM7_16695 [Thermoleophilaceae bacterium]